MTEHSKFPPSSAARRVACSGSRALEAKFPEKEESPHAQEGELAHKVASCLLQGMEASAIDYLHKSQNGPVEPITTEMWEGAELYVNCIESAIKQYGNVDLLKSINVEKRVDISVIHPECWGTPDAWFYHAPSQELHIWDYKFGHGFVEVFENWQLLEYAAGILSELGINGVHDQYTRITFYIVQPRHYHRDGPIRTWSVKASDLRALFNILRAAEEKAESDNAICTPNPECAYCLGRHACEALQRSALTTVDVSTSNTPFQLSPHSLGNELRYLKRAAELLEARITGLEEEANALIRQGNRVPFFKLEQTQGRERWKKSIEEVLLMGALMGVELAKPVEAITPKQAVKAGVPEELLTEYAERSPGAMKLILDENHGTAKKIFGANK